MTPTRYAAADHREAPAGIEGPRGAGGRVLGARERGIAEDRVRPAGVAALRGGRSRSPARPRARAAGPAAQSAAKRRCQRAVVVCLAEPSLSGCAAEGCVAREPRGLSVLVNPGWCNCDIRGGSGAREHGGSLHRGERGSKVTVSSQGQVLLGCCAPGPSPRQVLGMHRKGGLQVQASRQAAHTMGYLL